MAKRAHRGGEGLTSRELVQLASATVRAPDNTALASQGPIASPRVPTEELRELVKRTPEATNAVDWLTHGASRAGLFACKLTDQGLPGVRTQDYAVLTAVESLIGPMVCSEILELAVWYLLVPGEFYLYGYEDERAYRESERHRWVVLDAGNVKDHGKSYSVKYERDGREHEDTIDVTPSGGLTSPLIRIWQPDKEEPWRATSPILANLGVLRAIDKMTQLVPALADQRITGPRILAVSDRIEPPAAAPGRKFSNNKIVDRLARAVDAAKRNPSSIENLLPIILEGDLNEKVFEKLEWDTEYPELMVEILELLIRRLATGLPVPSEVTLGESDTNHWGQWFNEESTVKLSIEPLVGKVASALSRHWLPVVIPNGRDINEWVIGYDVRSVMLRPDRSAIAVQLRELGILSDEATRRETGFDEKDAPKPEELARRAQPSIGTPGPDPGQGDRQPQQQVNLDPDAGRSQRSLPAGGADSNGTPGGIDRGLQAAAAVTVKAALARAGSFLRGSRELRGMTNGMPTCELYTYAPAELRAGVTDDRIWPDGVLETFCATYGRDPDCAEALMRRHVQLCIEKGAPEPIEFLYAALGQCPVPPVEVG